MKEKDNWNFIFQGIGDDFEEFWKIKKKEYFKETIEEEKKRSWIIISNWIDEYSRLSMAIIPDSRIACLIETKQEYANFTEDDVLCVIENIGKLSQLLYCANRDVFAGVYDVKILAKYYFLALEQTVWLTASFVNIDKKLSNFTSLKERLKYIFKEGFEGRCGHFIYACEKCIKEKTGNRTKEDAERIIYNV